MKVLFLDIDGVLNSAQGYEYHHQNYNLRKQSDTYEKDKDDLIASGIPEKAARDMLMSREWDPICVANLRKILKDVPDLKIVVSSTWRMGYDVNTDEVKGIFNYFEDIKQRVIGRTLRLFLESDPHKCAQRGEEIKEWLSRHPEVTDFVCLDDDNDFDAVRGNFIRTSGETGLTISNARDCIRILNRKPGWRPSWFAEKCNSCIHWTRLNESKDCLTGTCQMIFHMFQSMKNNETGEVTHFTVGKDYSLVVMEDFRCPLHEATPWKGPNEDNLR